jgi:heat-inducible transcriptional repressor
MNRPGELKNRQKEVLRCIVAMYIDTATPVGSSQIIKKFRFNCSSATIRNEMADLEQAGFLKQPHTSAGRVPTDEGYRYFIDVLVSWDPLDSKEREKIRTQMSRAQENTALVLEEASKILGKGSNELGVVLTPWMTHGVFDRIDCVLLSERKVLLVVHVRNCIVKTFILEMDFDIKSKAVDQTRDLVNDRFSGWTVRKIQKEIPHLSQECSLEDKRLLRKISEGSTRFFDFSEPTEIHTCGTQNILCQPEFSDIGMLENILTLIEDRKTLINVFHYELENTKVIIGQENRDPRLQNMTVIATRYARGKDIGTLGVIGPTRMDYARILPLVDHIGQTMSELLS